MDQKKSKSSSKRAPKSKGPRIIDFDNPPPLLEKQLPPEEQVVDMASFAQQEQSINKMNEKSINFNDEIERSSKKINFSKKVNKIKDSEMKELEIPEDEYDVPKLKQSINQKSISKKINDSENPYDSASEGENDEPVSKEFNSKQKQKPQAKAKPSSSAVVQLPPPQVAKVPRKDVVIWELKKYLVENLLQLESFVDVKKLVC